MSIGSSKVFAVRRTFIGLVVVCSFSATNAYGESLLDIINDFIESDEMTYGDKYDSHVCGAISQIPDGFEGPIGTAPGAIAEISCYHLDDEGLQTTLNVLIIDAAGNILCGHWIYAPDTYDPAASFTGEGENPVMLTASCDASTIPDPGLYYAVSIVKLPRTLPLEDDDPRKRFLFGLKTPFTYFDWNF